MKALTGRSRVPVIRNGGTVNLKKVKIKTTECWYVLMVRL